MTDVDELPTNPATIGPVIVGTYPPRDDPYRHCHYADTITYPATALPFVWSRAGMYVHRVRYVTEFGAHDGIAAHTAPSSWCGTSVGRGRMSSHPDPDRTICGTCHGKAIGAGQIDHEGTPLIFTPRTTTPFGQCVWHSVSYHFAGGSSEQRCRSAARHPCPGVPGGGLCNQHHRAWPPRAGWRIVKAQEYAGESLTRHASVQIATALAALGVLEHQDIDPTEFWS